MAATWEYIREVSVQADRVGFHTTLVPELYLNDRKGVDAPSLEAWSLSASILAVTERLRVMTGSTRRTRSRVRTTRSTARSSSRSRRPTP